MPLPERSIRTFLLKLNQRPVSPWKPTSNSAFLHHLVAYAVSLTYKLFVTTIPEPDPRTYRPGIRSSIESYSAMILTMKPTPSAVPLPPASVPLKTQRTLVTLASKPAGAPPPVLKGA